MAWAVEAAWRPAQDVRAPGPGHVPCRPSRSPVLPRGPPPSRPPACPRHTSARQLARSAAPRLPRPPPPTSLLRRSARALQSCPACDCSGMRLRATPLLQACASLCAPCPLLLTPGLRMWRCVPLLLANRPAAVWLVLLLLRVVCERARALRHEAWTHDCNTGLHAVHSQTFHAVQELHTPYRSYTRHPAQPRMQSAQSEGTARHLCVPRHADFAAQLTSCNRPG